MDAYDLCAACSKESVAEVKKALSSGLNPNEADFTAVLPLCVAARAGNEEIVRLLIEAGADVNASEKSGFGEKGHNPLGAASCNGHLGVMNKLLIAGADINGLSQRSESALFVAAAKGQLEAVQLLLDKNANAELSCGYKRRTALHEACAWFKVDTVHCLLQNGAKVDCLDESACTPLHLVCHPELEKGAGAKLVTLLLDNGADVNVLDKYKRTPLLEAARWLSAEPVEKLITAGANVSYQDDKGMTALIGACHHNKDWQVVKLLIDNGASLSPVDEDGRTALHHAAYEEVSEKSVELLLAAGADADLEDKSGATPLSLAASSYHRDNDFQKQKMAMLLKASSKIPETVLFSAARSGNVELCRGLLKKGLSVDPRDDWQRTPLHWASSDGQSAAVIELIELGSDLEAVDENGNTPLHLACQKVRLDVVTALFLKGASSQKKNNKGFTALYYLDEESKVTLAESNDKLKTEFSKLDSALPKNLKCSIKAKNESGKCTKCNWQQEKDDRQRLHCPWCNHLSVSESDYEVLHGNPFSPAADTEVSFKYTCEHCGAAFSSSSSVFASNHTSLFSLDVSNSFFSDDGGKSWKRSWNWDD